MQLERNGNVIEDIKFFKTHIKITVKQEQIRITKDAYNELNLYIGKPVTDKDIEEIKDFSNMSKTLSYIYKILSKKRYSEKEIKKKLHAKNLKTSQISTILSLLKEKRLIDDSLFTLDFINEANLKKFGKNRILRDLKSRGIILKDENIFPYEEELNKAKSLVKKLEEKNSHLSYNLMIRKISSNLSFQGYEEDIINEVLPLISKKDSSKELSKLRKDMKIAYLRREKKNNGKLLKDKVIASLIAKGYELKDITKLWEEQGYEDDS